jgi:hypothetical protein
MRRGKRDPENWSRYKERWRKAKLNRREERIEEIDRLFEERGWRFFVEPEQRDSWAAWFLHEDVGPDVSDVVRRPTAVKAAEAAWEKFSRRPHVVSGSEGQVESRLYL